jgi:hypothetical protein
MLRHGSRTRKVVRDGPEDAAPRQERPGAEEAGVDRGAPQTTAGGRGGLRRCVVEPHLGLRRVARLLHHPRSGGSPGRE